MAVEISTLIVLAAEGDLPDWVSMSRGRRAHVKRVAKVLRRWAKKRGESETNTLRWLAAGFLHDSLKNAPEKKLKKIVPEHFENLPGPLLHGPAAAERLREDGIDDEAFLRAVAYHSIGHPDFDDLGKALYAADFLEPGRKRRPRWRATRRKRGWKSLDETVQDVLRIRIRHQVSRKRPLRAETVALWNRLSGGPDCAPASEL